MEMYRLYCRLINKMRKLGWWVVPDSLFIPAYYYLNVGEKLNVKNPTTFTEKMQWLKLHDHNELYHSLVDKLVVKDYVAKAIGEQYLIKTLAVWDSVDKIDLSGLPNQFVLKTTNGGGSTGVVICKDKNSFDLEEAKRKLRWSANYDIYKHMGEWVYKGLKPRIIAEELLIEKPSKAFLKDYKWYCFNGEPKYCQIIQNRDSEETIDFFDTEWNHQKFVGLNPIARSAAIPPSRPENLDIQIRIAKKLSNNIPFSRIDLYEVNQHTFWGEITFYAASGLGRFAPNEFNLILGEMIKLPGEYRGGGEIEVAGKEIDIIPIDIPDYKIWCFDGEPKILFYASNRFNKEKKPPFFDYYDMNLNKLSIKSKGHLNSSSKLAWFPQFEEMKQLAKCLSKDIPFVRTDFYCVRGKIYFGELTFYHDAGLVPFEPNSWNYKLGSMITLPNTKSCNVK